MHLTRRSTPFGVLAGVLLLAGALGASSAAAQTPHPVQLDPDELLSAFAREHQAPGDRARASLELTHVLTHHADYAAREVAALLRGLERLALSGETSRLRASAALRLALPGSHRSTRPMTGMVVRLERLYERSQDPMVRSVIVSAMADAAERRDALAFLERLAIQAPAETDFPGAAMQALATLAAMDADGRAVLKRLHETRAVQDPEARYDLWVLASRGYRIQE